eukprot:gene16151-7517_t
MGNLRNRTRKTSRKRKATSSFENIHKDEGKKQRNEAEAEPPTVAETTPSQGGEQPRPSNSEACSSTPLSRSSKKINKENENYYCEKENEDCGENSGFVLIDFAILSDVFSSLCCPVCKSLNLRLMELTGKRRGFAVTFCLICQGCAWEKEFVSSNSVTDKTKRSMEVNVRMIMAFRNIGCGLEAMNTYSMIMNMHKPMTQKNYNSLIDNLHVAYLEEAETCMKEAVEEVKEQSGSIDFTARKQSWCTWQKNKADGKTGYKHKSYLPSAIVDVVLPIYDDLSDKSLLTSCLDSFTQNPNESLNKLIWARCPKKIYQGRKVVELCTASAATHFNDGASSIARVLQRFHICPGGGDLPRLLVAAENIGLQGGVETPS